MNSAPTIAIVGVSSPVIGSVRVGGRGDVSGGIIGCGVCKDEGAESVPGGVDVGGGAIVGGGATDEIVVLVSGEKDVVVLGGGDVVVVVGIIDVELVDVLSDGVVVEVEALHGYSW
jgi:hypothetical protein